MFRSKTVLALTLLQWARVQGYAGLSIRKCKPCWTARVLRPTWAIMVFRLRPPATLVILLIRPSPPPPNAAFLRCRVIRQRRRRVTRALRLPRSPRSNPAKERSASCPAKDWLDVTAVAEPEPPELQLMSSAILVSKLAS